MTDSDPTNQPGYKGMPSDRDATVSPFLIPASLLSQRTDYVSAEPGKVPLQASGNPSNFSPAANQQDAAPMPFAFPHYPVHPEDGSEYAGLYPSNYDDSDLPFDFSADTADRNLHYRLQTIEQRNQFPGDHPHYSSVPASTPLKDMNKATFSDLYTEECNAMSPDDIPASGSPVLTDEHQSEFVPSAFLAKAVKADEPSVPEAEQESADVSSPSVMTDESPEPVLGLTDEEIESSPDSGDASYGALRIQLMSLQQQIHAAKIPVVIVFEGWHAAGKGTLLSKLIEGLDPRGYQVYPIHKPSESEARYPTMRQYWVDMPAQGNISLFCSSWYREVTAACSENKASKRITRQRYDEIISMESQLVCDGVLLLKFFLHISRKEQKKRLKELESRKSTRWRVTPEDWEQNDRYEDYLRMYDAMIARTHFDGAPWHILHSDDSGACVRQVYEIVIDAFRAALKDREDNLRVWDTPFLPHLESLPTVTFPSLETFDPEQALTEPYKPALDKAQRHLWKLQNELYRRKISLIACFEGWDAAGKGGAIRRLSASLDPRGFDVVPISAPTPLEKSHHHLWRFYQSLPRDGHIAIFDRTWYGRVMVERIEGFCTEPQWKRAYEEINRFEAELANHGTILCKFWLQIDNNTQLVRFEERQSTPDKQWKITDEDWRNRSKWPQYESAVNDMLQKTNTVSSPWTVIEANNKQYARLKVLQTVIAAAEHRLEQD